MGSINYFLTILVSLIKYWVEQNNHIEQIDTNLETKNYRLYFNFKSVSYFVYYLDVASLFIDFDIILLTLLKVYLKTL